MSEPLSSPSAVVVSVVRRSDAIPVRVRLMLVVTGLLVRVLLVSVVAIVFIIAITVVAAIVGRVAAIVVRRVDFEDDLLDVGVLVLMIPSRFS